MSEKSRSCFNVARAISDSSGLEGSVLIRETLLRKGSEDHKKPPQSTATGWVWCQRLCTGLSASFRALLEEVLCPYRPDQGFFLLSAFPLTHLSAYLIMWMSLQPAVATVLQKMKVQALLGFFFPPKLCFL